MNKEVIQNKIGSFPRWHYEIDLDGIKTPIHDKSKINRHNQRYDYFFKPLLDKYSGSLKGKKILDLGCNAGYWSLKAIEADCDYVFGIDARQMHVDQSNFIFEAKDVPPHKYNFKLGNVFRYDFESLGRFDIVFFFGLMYHINKPIEILEIISAINSETLVIDTSLTSGEGSYLTVIKEDINDPRNSVEYELVLVPTRDAVIDLCEAFSYKVDYLPVNFSSYEGSKDYEIGRRGAFICQKT